jgi:type II secretory pathway pseudopilin PulG
MNEARIHRSGAALLWALVVLSVLGVTSAVAVREFATARQTLVMRQNRIQAEWLARAGAEMAVARLFANGDYAGETVEPIASAAVHITVEKDATKPSVYRIGSEVTFPVGDYRAVHFTLHRTATRRAEGGKVTVELKDANQNPP